MIYSMNHSLAVVFSLTMMFATLAVADVAPIKSAEERAAAAEAAKNAAANAQQAKLDAAVAAMAAAKRPQKNYDGQLVAYRFANLELHEKRTLN